MDGGSICMRVGRNIVDVLLMTRFMGMGGITFCLGLSMREIGVVA